MKQLASVLMCTVLLVCGWIIGSSNQSSVTAKELPTLSVNWQSMPIDYQFSHSQQKSDLTGYIKKDTVVRVDTVYIPKIQRVRVPYKAETKDTIYYPMIFIIRPELPVSSSTPDSVRVDKFLPDGQE